MHRKALLLSIIVVSCVLTSFVPKDGFMKGYQFYREFEISHEKSDSVHYHSEYRILLSAHQEYKVAVTNCNCDAIIKIYDVDGNFVASNYIEKDDKCHESIIYRCKATRYYSLIIESRIPDPSKSKKKSLESRCQIGSKRF